MPYSITWLYNNKLTLKSCEFTLVQLNSWVQPSFGGLIDNSGLGNCSLKKGQRRTGEGKGKGKGQAAGSESSSGKRPSKKRRADSEASEFRSLSQELLTSDHQDEPWVDKHRPCSQVRICLLVLAYKG